MRRLPRPLLALCALGLLLAMAWSLITPPFQGPDEPAHFAYVQTLVEDGVLPGDPGKSPFSTEHVLAAMQSNADQAAAQPTVPMSWRPDAFLAWSRQQDRLPPAARADGGGPNPAASNPPLAYLTGAVGYAAAQRGDFFDRLLAVRLTSVLWLPLAIVGVWLLAGEVLGRGGAQVAAAALPALAPMSTFVFGIVTPDGPLIALWSLALWLGVRLLRRPPSASWALALGTVVGLGVLVKATTYALVPATALALVMAGVRHRAPRVPVAGLAGLVLTAGAWLVGSRVVERPGAAQLAEVASSAQAAAGASGLREFASYLWQYYLPRPPFLQEFPSVAETLPAYDLMFKQVWAAFGWTEVLFPQWVYVVLLAVSAAAVVVAAVRLWRGRQRLDWRTGAFLALAVAALVGGLHVTDYVMLEQGRSNFIQGRYLLPLVGAAALIPGLLLRHRGALALSGWLASLLVFNLASLGLMLWRYGA